MGLWDCVRSRVVSDELKRATACRLASADTVIPALPLPILKPPNSDKMLSYLNSGDGSWSSSNARFSPCSDVLSHAVVVELTVDMDGGDGCSV